MSIPGIGPLSAAVIYSEYGDISNFSSPNQMLAFAGIEPGINESGTESHGGRMVNLWLNMIAAKCRLANIHESLVYVRVGNGFDSKRGSKERITGWKTLHTRADGRGRRWRS